MEQTPTEIGGGDSNEPQISRKEAMKNWLRFDMDDSLAQSLVANKFLKPTPV
jgi:hypothetical protein